MTKETLERAKYLEGEIEKYDLVVDNLERDIDFLEKGSTYDKNILAMQLRYSERNGGVQSDYQRVVSVTVPRPVLMKIIREELYVANNLLKKYKLELEKL